MNQQQAKYLRARLTKAHHAANPYGPRPNADPEPIEVTKARKLLRDWGNRVSNQLAARRKKIEAAVGVVEEAILFGDADAALAALKKFEAMKF